MTKDERDLLHEIDTKLARYIERNDRLIESQDKIKVDVRELRHTVYENGLNTKVDQLYKWMLEQREAAKQTAKAAADMQLINDQQAHEEAMQGKKLSAETRLAIIQGTISIIAIIATAILSR